MIPERSGQIVALEGHGTVRTIGVVRGTPNLLDHSAAHGIAGRLVGVILGLVIGNAEKR